MGTGQNKRKINKLKPDHNLSHKTFLAGAILSGILLHLLLSFKFSQVSDRLDLAIYDMLLRNVPAVARNPQNKKIVILAIDEKTEQLFPEPMVLWHKYYARVIEKLSDSGVKAIAFDMIFNASLSGSPMDMNKEETAFLTAVKNAGEKGIPVLSGYSLDDNRQNFIPKRYQDAFGKKNMGFLNHSAKNDIDGKIRRFTTCTGTDCSMMFKFLSRELAKDINKNIILQKNPTIYIDYRIPGKLPVYSLCDVYQQALKKNFFLEFKDKYILIGHTSWNSKDFAPVPVKLHLQEDTYQKIPGVLINYYIGKTLLSDQYFSTIKLFGSKRTQTWTGILIVILIPVLVFQAGKHISSKWLSFSIITLIVSGLALSFWTMVVLFHSFKVVNIAGLILPVIISAVFSIIFRMFFYHKERKIILREFGSFLSPQVVQQLIYDKKRRDEFKKGVKKKITIMFADIRNYTTICNQYENAAINGVPESHLFVKQLNEYMVAMTRIIDTHHGFLNRIVGDGLLVLFGAFEREEEQADDSIRCGVAMLEKVKEMNQKASFFTRPDSQGHLLDTDIDIGIGVNTGDAIITCSGGDVKKEFTVIGSSANKAARIESLTKGIRNMQDPISDKTEIFSLIMGSETEKMLSDSVKATLDLEDFGGQELKGFTEPQHVYVSKKYKKGTES